MEENTETGSGPVEVPAVPVEVLEPDAEAPLAVSGIDRLASLAVSGIDRLAMLFIDPQLSDPGQLQVTVRHGIKWAGTDGQAVDIFDAANPTVPLASGQVVSTFQCKLSEVPAESLALEHAADCRTQEGLMATMERAYPGIQPTADVTVVTFAVSDTADTTELSGDTNLLGRSQPSAGTGTPAADLQPGGADLDPADVAEDDEPEPLPHVNELAAQFVERITEHCHGERRPAAKYVQAFIARLSHLLDRM